MELIQIAHQVLTKCSLEDGSNRDGKIKAARTLAEHLPLVSHAGDKVIAAGIHALLRLHADADMVVWPVAEESLFTVLRALVAEESLGERVMVELFKGIRPGAEKEKMRRVALLRFADFISYLAPGRCRRFLVALLPILLDIVKECSEPMMETLASCMDKILEVLAFYCKEKEIRELILAVVDKLKQSPSSASKRSCADIVGSVCKIYPRPEWEFCIVSVEPLLQSAESGVAQGGLVLLTALAREAAYFVSRPQHRDPRVPLSQFGGLLMKLAQQALSHEAPLVLQAAAELCAKLPSALPFAVDLRPERKPLRRALKMLVFGKAGASRRASALQALAVWGGLKRGSAELLHVDEDPLVRGSALVALAKGGGVDAHTVLQHTRDESPVVARLAFEALAEFRKFEDVVRQGPVEYWVVEKQRLSLIGLICGGTSLRLRREALDALIVGLGNSDPRVRAEAAKSICQAAPYLGVCEESPVQSDNDVMVLEGAWKSVPSIAHELFALMRRTSSQHMLLGLHEAVCELAIHWSSPRRYLKRESARLAACQQRPLHSSWPNPLQSLFASYAARSVSQLIARPNVLMVNLEHHQRVLLGCAALAKGGASSCNSWPLVLLHCLRVACLYDPSHDPSDTSGDDNEVLNGGGLPYVALQGRLVALRCSSLPSETGVYFDLLKASLKLLANLCKDISRPVATFGHLILDVCRIALPLVPAACLSLCRAIAPLCFRPATAGPQSSNASIMSPGSNVPATPATKQQAQAQRPLLGLSVPAALTYASGLGRPTLVAEDFPASLKFSSARVETALRMRPLLPGKLEPLVLKSMELYSKSSSGRVQARTLDLVVTLIRCGVDYNRLDPKGLLIAAIQQQILGKRAYLKSPVRIMPSMYTFLGVLATADGPVDGAMLMQVAAPVFGSPYWRSNARLVPSLRWMLRDLIVRRRMQLQKDPNAPPDSYADVRAHFISCIVSKLPHEEAVEMLEALIRAARPVNGLVAEIAIPTLNAVISYAKSGKLLVWRPAQWTAWKGLVARVLQQNLPVPSLESLPAHEVVVALDFEDPNSVLAEACAPLGVLAGKLLLQRLGFGKDSLAECLSAAMSSPQVAKCAGDLLEMLRKEAEPSGPKRILFSEVTVAAPVTEPSINLLLQFDQPVGTWSAALSPPSKRTEPLPSIPLNMKAELPLLKVETVSASADIPDDLYPLPQALYSHSTKLLRLRSRLSRAELDQILLSAEALVMADPDRNLNTDRALECLRGAILRPASTALVTSSNQCCPKSDQLRISISPLWKLENDEDVPNLAIEPRALAWRRALSYSGWSDEEDTLIGFVPASIPGATSLPPPSIAGSLVRAYGIMCRVLRDPPSTRSNPSVASWARQWANWSKVVAIQGATSAILEISNNSMLNSSMDSHERVDMLLRGVPSPQVYCVDIPKMLIGGEAMISGSQAIAMLMTHLVRSLRSDCDLTPIVHVVLKVLPRFATSDISLYFPSILEACSRNLFLSIVAMLCHCVLNNRLEAHKIAHELHSHRVFDFSSIVAQLQKDFKPLADVVAGLDGNNINHNNNNSNNNNNMNNININNDNNNNDNNNNNNSTNNDASSLLIQF